MKRVTLSELVGKGVDKRKLKLDDLNDILGDRMPKLEFHPVGRLRLVTALQNRFGKDYRNLPGIDDLLEEFDENASFQVKLAAMKMIRGGGKKG